MSTDLNHNLWGGYNENGRLYHSFQKGKYFLPCDEDEQDRLDIFHKFFSLLEQYRFRSTTLTGICDKAGSKKTEKKGPKVLDLGTGTGIWAIDTADKIFGIDGEVYGVDLAWIQPANIPPNIKFMQRDVDLPWYDLSENIWDLVHIRMLNGGVSDWPGVYRKAFNLLKPGKGYIEHLEIDFIPRCDDGTFPASSALLYWARMIYEATEEAGQPLSYNVGTGALLSQTGFEDIQEQVIKIPLNTWPRDPHLKEIGRWYNLGFSQGLQAIALAPLTRIKNWRIEKVNHLCNAVRKEICCQNYHVYHNLHVWHARRPKMVGKQSGLQ